MPTFSYLLIIFSAFAGFLLAFYIGHKKRAKETLVCPIGADCEAVVHSEFSRFFGIPVEILGLFYYAVIASAYAAFLAQPLLAVPGAVFALLILTTTAFLFSLYLTFIQALALRQWCSWCLTSAGLCTVIFFAALGGSPGGFIELMAAYREHLAVANFFALALGVGGATIADLFFLKFLKDFRISEGEAEILRTITQVIWFAIALLVLSGLALYLPDAARLNNSPVFLVKIIALVVLMANGAVLNFLISPRLVKISFGGEHKHEAGELHFLRKFSFALGAISLASWYIIFILHTARLSIEFLPLIGLYVAALLAAVIASQLIEMSFERSAE